MHYALRVYILINMYMPNHLVYHVLATNASISGHIVQPSKPLVYLFYNIFHYSRTQFYLIELRSTLASLSSSASQLHKYVSMYMSLARYLIHTSVHLLLQ